MRETFSHSKSKASVYASCKDDSKVYFSPTKDRKDGETVIHKNAQLGHGVKQQCCIEIIVVIMVIKQYTSKEQFFKLI